MKKRQNNSARASALQITLSAALLAISAILFASSFKAAPPSAPVSQNVKLQQDGFYPPLVVPATPQQPGFFPPLPLEAPLGAPAITVSLPIATLDTSVPASTIIIQPVMTTL